MIEAAEVLLWGTRIGHVSMKNDSWVSEFRYDGEFLDFGIEPSPLMMPVSSSAYSFPALREASFHGLPGMLSDSVPDKFGNAVINEWLKAEGRLPNSLTPIERLSYTGTRGMGALEYRPTIMRGEDQSEVVHVDKLSELAAAALADRKSASLFLNENFNSYASILKVGTSAGGARAKALIGLNEKTGEVRSGQVKLPEDFGYWLIKFDGVSGNGDKDGEDAAGYGKREYEYYLKAKAAGIEMMESRLWQGRHFMTRRFDRTENGGKLHTQTLAALAHFDYNDPNANSYEQAFKVTRRLVNDVRADRQLVRRMAFNVYAWNCDDHVKNISYIMNRSGEWALAPAYDLCYAYNPTGDWTSGHQMSINGKRRGITDEDMLKAALTTGLSRAEILSLLSQVKEVLVDES